MVAAGCATRASVREIQTDVGTIRAELTEVRLAQDLVATDLARVLAELRSMDVRAAETQQTVRDAASEVVRLRTRLQAAEDELRQTRSGQGPQPSGPAAPPGAVTPAPPPRPGVVATVPAALPAPAETDAPRAARVSAEQTFAAAVKTFRAHEHGQAVLEFIDFVANYPKHGLVPRAQWWIGEAYYVQRDYQQALLEFQRVLTMDPGVLAASDALLRIGMCHAKLRQSAAALAAWERIVREFPRSEAAGKARSLLSAAAVSH
ncbi:MAG TPA: tol-pal system protein YbgF [Methylomirabilota bacterium]